MPRASKMKWTPDRNARLFFLNELRAARTEAQKNAEDFAGLLFAFERLGVFLAVEDDGTSAADLHGLGSYSHVLTDLASFSTLGGRRLEAGTRRWHSPFECLFRLVADARNSALHEGAKARHLTEHAIELALIFEEALAQMAPPLRTVGDLMVRSPVIAQPWQPVSFVRQAMLTNSFSYVPVFIGEEWKLISDHAVAQFLGGAGTAGERRVRMAMSISKAEGEFLEMRLPTALTVAETSAASDLFGLSSEEDANGRLPVLSAPVLVLAESVEGDGRSDEHRLVGLITAFDLL